MPSHKVLIVEDEALIRMALSDMLEDRGYAVIEACNVLEAVAALGKHTDILAIVTDIDMPGPLDGLDLVRLVQRCDTRIAVIVASGGRILDSGDLPSGCQFFSKPYRDEAIALALDAMIAVPAVRLQAERRLA